MGYFNYFIKCIIRNIAYKLCKPKVFFTVLLSVIILFGLKHYGFCALTDDDYVMISDGFATVTTNQGTAISFLSSIGVDVDDISKELDSITAELDNIGSYTSNMNETLSNLYLRVNSLNTTISLMYEQQNLHYQNVSSELESIRKILIGADLETFTFPFEIRNYKGLDPAPFSPVTYQATVTDNINMGYFTIDYKFEGGYTYDIVCNSTNSTYASHIFYTYDTISTGNIISVNYAITSTPASAAFSISPKKDSTVTLIFNQPVAFPGLMDWTITKKSSSSLSGINNTIEQGNQLQQQQNQLQQEQNDFLKQEQTDSDVSVDGFNSVDSNDITSDGLTGVFTNIYNSITSWSSKDISLPIPYTNKSIDIPANYTHNMLSSFGGSWIITFISSIYYFIVARFIIYSITSIINSIKSGSILETDSKKNITTDML